jgi:hypothetical protein
VKWTIVFAVTTIAIGAFGENITKSCFLKQCEENNSNNNKIVLRNVQTIRNNKQNKQEVTKTTTTTITPGFCATDENEYSSCRSRHSFMCE